MGKPTSPRSAAIVFKSRFFKHRCISKEISSSARGNMKSRTLRRWPIQLKPTCRPVRVDTDSDTDDGSTKYSIAADRETQNNSIDYNATPSLSTLGARVTSGD